MVQCFSRCSRRWRAADCQRRPHGGCDGQEGRTTAMTRGDDDDDDDDDQRHEDQLIVVKVSEVIDRFALVFINFTVG